MVDKKTPETTKKPKPKKPLSSPIKKSSNFVSPVSIVAIIVALVALIFAGWLWQQQKTSAATLQQSLSDAQDQLAGLTHTLNANEEALQKQHSEISDLHNKLQQLQGSHDHTLVSLQESLWLVRMAELHASINHDYASASALLSKADAQLKHLNNSSFTHARRLLAESLLSLQAVSHVDYSGIALRIDALSRSISKLPALSLKPELAQQENGGKEKLVGWRAKLQHSLNFLKSFVVIRHNQVPTNLNMTAKQFAWYKANLISELNLSKWALLNHKVTLFKHSLQQVKQSLQKHYNQPQRIANIVQSLTALQKTPLLTKMPELGGIVTALQSSIEHYSNEHTSHKKAVKKKMLPLKASKKKTNVPPRSPQRNSVEA